MTFSNLLAKNPWKDVAANWQEELKKKAPRFVLEKDEAVVLEYKTRSKNCELHLDVLPQPFIGDPQKAKFWILNMNPSYSAQDVIDMRTGQDKNLPQRQALMLESFTLKPSVPFYAVDESFHTIPEDSPWVGHVDGTWQWWMKSLIGRKSGALCCNGDVTLAKHFFVLELFPYHSKSFGSGLKKILTQTAHFNFIEHLIKWGAENDKIFILRGTDWPSLIEKWCGRAFLYESKRVFHRVSQSAVISENNLALYPHTDNRHKTFGKVFAER